MKILAFDTCFSTCSLALIDNEKIVVKYQDDEPFRQAGKLIPYIEKAMEEAALEYKALDAIAVTTGPGSFTGIRIGLSAANAISLVTGTRVIGISTLEAMAFQAHKKFKNFEKVISVVNSYKKQLSVQEFTIHDKAPEIRAVKAPALIEIDEIRSLKFTEGKTFFTGNARELISDKIGKALLTDNITVDAEYVARIAAQKIETSEVVSINEPVYMRKPDAKLPKNRQKTEDE